MFILSYGNSPGIQEVFQIPHAQMAVMKDGSSQGRFGTAFKGVGHM
jgi:hypothetical protein